MYIYIIYIYIYLFIYLFMCVRVLIYMHIRSKPVMESTSISTWIQTGSTIDIQYVVIPKKGMLKNA